MRRAGRVPERISWAVGLVAPGPDDQVLEVGCGNGVAAALVAERLTTGHVTAIDRSLVAVERARSRNREHLESGRASFHHADLASLEHPDGTLAKVFAVNVNLFWTTDATVECLVLARALAPGGRLWLVYEVPGDKSRNVADTAAGTLRSHGWEADTIADTAGGLTAVLGRPPSEPPR